MALASERVRERPTAPTVRAEWTERKRGSPELKVRPGHADIDGWAMQLKNTFGTASIAFASMETDRLVSALGLTEREPPETKINAALAAMAAAQPADEIEAMLASQIVAAHTLIMDLLARTKRADTMEKIEAYGGLTNRLMRAYAGHAEVLAKLKRGGEQTVRVEHVHVHAGGQAVVGNINHGGRGHGKNGHRPHTEGTAGAAVRCEDPKRVAVSRARDG